MNETRLTAGWQRFFVTWGSILLTIGFLFWARAILLPVVLAILLAFVLAPVVGLLQRRGLGRIPSAILVVVLACGFVAGVATLVLVQVRNLAVELPQKKDKILQRIEDWQEASRGSVWEKVGDSLQEITQGLRAATRASDNTQRPVPVEIQSWDVTTILQSAANPLVEGLVTITLIIILVAFMLIQRENLRNRLLRLWGNGRLTSMTRAMDDAMQRISRFLQMQLLVNVSYGLILSVGFHFIGVPYALLWGFLAGVLRYIPYLGAWIGAILPLLVSITLVDNWMAPLLVLALVAASELTISNVLEPLLYGHSIGVSEVALLIMAAFWAWLWGPFGLILSTPLTACVLVLGRYVPQLEFFSILLGDEPVLEPHVVYYQRLLARDEYEATELVNDYVESHTAEAACKDLLLPALTLARLSRDNGDLTEDDEQRILRVTHDLLDENLPAVVETEPNEDKGEAGERVCVLGCPARDEVDALALEMLGRLVSRPECKFEITVRNMLFGEIAARIKEIQPAAVAVVSLGRGSLPHVRYLCKRLRKQFANLKIVVACWGLNNEDGRVRQRLQAAGADLVGLSFAESQAQLSPIVQFLPHAPKEVTAAASS